MYVQVSLLRRYSVRRGCEVAEGAEHFLSSLVGWGEERRRGEVVARWGGEREARKVRRCGKREVRFKIEES